MDPLVIVSPHFDDAVLSCGQLMAGRPDCVIATVFTLPPGDGAVTEFDRRSGFSSAYDAVHGRQLEDDLAARTLRATTRRLQFVDHQYRLGVTADRNEIASAVEAVALDVGASRILGPLGVEHPDHLAVSDAVVELRDDFEVVLYEELPGRVLWPEHVCERIATLRQLVELDLTFVGTGPVHLKADAVGQYRSQAWALDRRCLFVPERYWQLR